MKKRTSFLTVFGLVLISVMGFQFCSAQEGKDTIVLDNPYYRVDVLSVMPKGGEVKVKEFVDHGLRDSLFKGATKGDDSMGARFVAGADEQKEVPLNPGNYKLTNREMDASFCISDRKTMEGKAYVALKDPSSGGFWSEMILNIHDGRPVNMEGRIDGKLKGKAKFYPETIVATEYDDNGKVITLDSLRRSNDRKEPGEILKEITFYPNGHKKIKHFEESQLTAYEVIENERKKYYDAAGTLLKEEGYKPESKERKLNGEDGE